MKKKILFCFTVLRVACMGVLLFAPPCIQHRIDPARHMVDTKLQEQGISKKEEKEFKNGELEYELEVLIRGNRFSCGFEKEKDDAPKLELELPDVHDYKQNE